MALLRVARTSLHAVRAAHTVRTRCSATGPVQRTDGWPLLRDVSWRIYEDPNTHAAIYLDDGAEPTRPLTPEEWSARVHPPSTLPDGSWNLILGDSLLSLSGTGKTNVKAGATVRDVLCAVFDLHNLMETPHQGTQESCMGSHVYWEGFVDDAEEAEGVFKPFIGS